MEKQTSGKCPKCGSEKVRMKRSWSSVLLWAALFVIALIVAMTAKDDRLNAGATSLSIVFGIATVGFALMAKWGTNRCLDCRHRWN
jgi:ssDNA-binding Zn-finger/Zn-ribbon topoisomerase 1